MVRVQAQQPEPVAVAVGHRTESLADPQAVKHLPARTLPEMDGFPFHPRIRLDLPPSHRPYALQLGTKATCPRFSKANWSRWKTGLFKSSNLGFIRH
jgi:hypothetical protein